MDILNLTETVAAISAEFHADSRFEDWYTKHKDTLGGFVGIWRYCGEAAIAFEAAWEDYPFEETEADWTDCVTAFAKFLLTQPPQTVEQFKDLAHREIELEIIDTLNLKAESMAERLCL
jgi:hypothetical protein